MVNRIVSACVVVAALTVAAPAHALVFPFHEPEPLGAVADAIVALDFDGNGWGDVAGVSRDAATLVLNDELGFDEAQTLGLPAATSGPVAVTGGDLDGDGREELLVALGDEGTLLVFQGRKSGGLGTPQVLSLRSEASQRAAGVAAADVDDDGDVDVVAAFGTSATVLVNDGDGELAPAAGPLTIPPVRDLQLVRLVGDEDPDLVVLSADALTVLPGAPAAGFGTPATHPLLFAGTDLATGDVNGDGRLDVGVTYERKDDYSPAPGVFSGTESGGLIPVTHTALVADAHVLADFDGDDVTDRYTSHHSAAFAHGAAGGFGTFNWGVSARGPREDALAAADFDGDGKLDVAGVEAGDGALNVRYSTGPQLVVSDANTWFGERPVGGGSSMIAVRVRNEGGGVARNLELVTEGDEADFEILARDCERAVLRLEESCRLEVYFRPRTLGPRSLELAAFAEDSTVGWAVTLEGEGVSAPPAPPPNVLNINTHPIITWQPPRAPVTRVMPPRPKLVRPGAPSLKRPTLAGLRRSGLRFTQAIGTAEQVTWTLEHRGTVLARTQRPAAVGQVSVTLKLTAAGRRVLAKRKPTSLKLRTKGTLERVTTIKLRRR